MTISGIKVTTRGEGMEEALAATEKLGLDSGLSHKENLRLRLLAEELIGLLRGISGDVEADYQARQEGKKFVLSLNADVRMTQDMRKQLLAASSSGKNSAARGFMGRLREMVAAILLPENGDSDEVSGLALGLMSLGGPARYTAGVNAYAWSMSKYMSEVRSSREADEDAADAWDELEKSIVANLADEVSVKIVGSTVEISIAKAF